MAKNRASDSLSSDGDESGVRRLDDLLAGYIDRLNSGERLDPEEIEADHPGLAAALLEHLETFAQMATEEDGPRTLGDYTLRRQIGQGGMGIVYDAWQNSMNRRVALKVLPVGISADPKACARFMREAQAAGRLSHPNIVAVFAMGVDDKTPYYAMEYLEGETLAEILKKLKTQPEEGEAQERALTTLAGLLDAEKVSAEAATVESKLPSVAVIDTERVRDAPDSRANSDPGGITPAYYRRLAETFTGIADGLHYAHGQGVIHRDIKPSNLMLDTTGKLRILDFGLARLEGEQSLTMTGDFLGTVLYVSPEQAMVRRVAVDHRTDIYSLGATMYELLTWRPPFAGKSAQDTLGQIIFRDPRPLRRSNSRIPRDLETIVLKCLRKDPKDRYGTAEELAQDLRRFTHGEPIQARPQSKLEKLVRRAWRYKVRIGVAAAFLTVVAILVAVLVEQKNTRMTTHRIWDVSSDVDVQAISRDGRHLSYRVWDAEPGNAGLWVRNLVSGEHRRLAHASPPEHAGGSAFSPDGREIAYSWQRRDGVPELRVMAVDGSKLRALYRGEELYSIEPHAWSRDGREILVTFHKKDTTAQIALVSLAEGIVRVIKSFDRGVVVEEALFSPDGQTVAYESRPSDWYSASSDLFLLSVDGTRETPIAEYPTDDSLLFWALDGLVYFARRDHIEEITMDLWCIPVTDGQPVGQPSRLRGLSIAESEALRAMKPLCGTGDGSYFYGVSVGKYCVYTVGFDLDAGSVTEPPQLISQEPSEPSPRWSPSGQHLAFLSQDKISILSLESGKPREIQPELKLKTLKQGKTRSLRWLSWSPDGRSLVATGRIEYRPHLMVPVLFRLDAQSGETTPLGGSVSNAQYSPDGRTLLGGTRPRKWEEIIDPGLWGTRITQLKGRQGRQLMFALSRRALDPLAVCFALSPDGRLLAFTEYEEGTKSWALKIVPIDGGRPGTPRELFRAESVAGLMDPWSGYLADLSWTPDGSGVLFRVDRPRPGFYMRVPAGGGEARKLDLKLRGVTSLRVHPDGRRVALAVDTSTQEIWAMENIRSAAKSGGQDPDLGRSTVSKSGTAVKSHDQSFRWVGGTWAVKSGPYFVAIFRDRHRFAACLKGNVRTVTFDDIETTDDQPASFASDRYRRSDGIVIRGMDGQYADRCFLDPDEFSPSSPPNMYAPGPRGYMHSNSAAGGSQTEVTFSAEDRPGTVAGFGAVFVDADGTGPCSITLFDHNGEVVGSESGFRGGDASHLFRGIVVLNEEGDPVPAIAHVRILSGAEWPSLEIADGVPLDDFTFGTPVPSQREILLPEDALSHPSREAEVRWISGIRAVRSGPYFVGVCRDRERFVACLKGKVREVTFDDVETTQIQPTSFAADRYRRSHGIVIQGQDGQFADRSFRHPAEFSPSSPPNMYAPGPRGERHSATDGGGSRTDVTFSADGHAATVTGFGAVFVDADYTGPCSITVFDHNGEILGKESGFRGAASSHLFRGIVVLSEEGDPVPMIAHVRILSGDEWPSVDVGDGVPLDDFTFGVPVSSENEILPPKGADSTETADGPSAKGTER